MAEHAVKFASFGEAKKIDLGSASDQDLAVRAIGDLYRFALSARPAARSHRDFKMTGAALVRIGNQLYLIRGANRKIVPEFDPSRTCAEMQCIDRAYELREVLYPHAHVDMRILAIMNVGDVQPDDASGVLPSEGGTPSCGHCRREFIAESAIDNRQTITMSATMPNGRTGLIMPERMLFSTPDELVRKFGILTKQGAWRS